MITEDYVSFETAKLLKEKGFDVYTYAYYEDEDDPNISLYASKAINWNKTEFISKPTLQMAMKWLETTYGKFICIDKHFYVTDKISHIASGVTYSYDIKHINIIHKETGFTTYEDAVEAAIKYCLEKLI